LSYFRSVDCTKITVHGKHSESDDIRKIGYPHMKKQMIRRNATRFIIRIIHHVFQHTHQVNTASSSPILIREYDG